MTEPPSTAVPGPGRDVGAGAAAAAPDEAWPAGQEPAPDPTEFQRRVLLVAGAGRSGTSTLAGIMSRLGLHVPLPEVPPDESNPKGFGESQWVVENHDRLLAEAGVTVGDSRPQAWFETGRVATREPERMRTTEWLEPHFAQGRELLVKDPRLSWFLPLWRVAAVRAGATPVFATMLRPPAEVVGSKQKYYRNRLGSAHLAASWTNMLLHTERATRSVRDAEAPEAASPDGGARVFVRYEDLLSDWTRTTMRVGEELGLQHVLQAPFESIRDVHRFVDPTLRRVSVTLEDLHLPRRLHDLVGQVWEELNGIAEPGGDTRETHRVMDQLREEYVTLYEESEAIARSTAIATAATAREQGRKQGRDQAAATAPTERPAGAAPPPKPARVYRVPHGIRAAIPPRVRRGVRRALGRPRPGA